MKLVAIIPVKPFADGKSRLKDVLSDAARCDFNRQMFDHVLNVTSAAVGTANVIVVSADELALSLTESRGAIAVPEPSSLGLNAALKAGVEAASQKGADAVMILPTDLPTLGQDDLRAIMESVRISPCVIIAPDRWAQGTKTILISPPNAIEFSFGPGSFEAHRLAAGVANIKPETVYRDGLSFDVDTPEDYRRLTQGW
jgi:2-phospho-L-lactate guanylyltransferase